MERAKTTTLAAIGIACLFLSAPAFGADSKLPPMDAAASQDHLPDTVTPDGIHIGTWSASHPDAGRGAPVPPAATGTTQQQQGHLPDTVLENGIHVGSWSANSAAAATPAGTAAAPAPGTAQDAADDSMQSHSMTVTSLKTCYDQLGPAEAAEAKKNFLKPYAECQSRLEAREESKKELKQGDIQKSLTPESPRNYIRVQAPERAPERQAADAPNPPAKSGITTNP